jgi:hypothetical protein
LRYDKGAVVYEIFKTFGIIKTIIAFIGMTFSTQTYAQETSSNKVANKTGLEHFCGR